MTPTTIEAAETLPRWDLSSIFPGPESPEFREAVKNSGLAIADLTDLFDQHGIGTRPMVAIDAAPSRCSMRSSGTTTQRWKTRCALMGIPVA